MATSGLRCATVAEPGGGFPITSRPFRQLLGPLGISAGGMSRQQKFIEVIATNIANAETTRTAQGGPYQRQVAVAGGDPANGSLTTQNRPQKKAGGPGSGPGHPRTPPWTPRRRRQRCTRHRPRLRPDVQAQRRPVNARKNPRRETSRCAGSAAAAVSATGGAGSSMIAASASSPAFRAVAMSGTLLTGTIKGQY